MVRVFTNHILNFSKNYRHGLCLHEPYFEFFKDMRPAPDWAINPVCNGKTFKVQFVIVCISRQFGAVLKLFLTTAMVRVFTNHILNFSKNQTCARLGDQSGLPPWFVSFRFALLIIQTYYYYYYFSFFVTFFLLKFTILCG
jgi:hypothetical protein